MDSERRSNYRAQAAESRPGTLSVGGRRTDGYILDESSGGLCFLAISNFPVEIEAEGELTEINNLPTAVRVVYSEPSSLRTRIGLRRSDSEMGSARKKTSARWRTAMAAASALAGLALGMLFARGPRWF